MNRIVICLFPVLVVVLTPAVGHAGPPSNSMQFFGCASEGGACTIGNFVNISSTQATKLVAYGDATSSRWVYRNMSGSFVCSNATFGDPAPGATKTCVFAPYQFAASEGGSYSIFATTPGLAIGGVNVAYGANGSFVYKMVTGSMGTCGGGSLCLFLSFPCNNSTFGADPAPGLTKACYLPLPEYAVAASEGQTLTVAQPHTAVAYGANGSFVFTEFTGSATCSNATFGRDPTPGIGKACYVLQVGQNGVIASEGQAYSTGGTDATVMYGAAAIPNFMSSSAISGTCSSSFFGGDPAIGLGKKCWADVFVIK